MQSGALSKSQRSVVPRAGADLEMKAKQSKQGSVEETLDIISRAVKRVSDKIFGASQAPSSPPLVRILPPEYFMVIGRHQVDHSLTSSTTTFRIFLFPASNQQRPGDVFLPFFSLFPCSPSSRLHPTLSFACHNYTLSLLEGR